MLGLQMHPAMPRCFIGMHPENRRSHAYRENLSPTETSPHPVFLRLLYLFFFSNFRRDLLYDKDSGREKEDNIVVELYLKKNLREN